jgi:hypothetical protein
VAFSFEFRVIAKLSFELKHVSGVYLPALIRRSDDLGARDSGAG